MKFDLPVYLMVCFLVQINRTSFLQSMILLLITFHYDSV